MATSGLTLEEIYEYFKQKGGTVSNSEVVRHFKRYLTDPASKGESLRLILGRVAPKNGLFTFLRCNNLWILCKYTWDFSLLDDLCVDSMIVWVCSSSFHLVAALLGYC